MSSWHRTREVRCPDRDMNRNSRPLLSVEEAAILLGETRSTLYRAVKAGTLPLPVFRIGSRIRSAFAPSSVLSTGWSLSSSLHLPSRHLAVAMVSGLRLLRPAVDSPGQSSPM